MAVGSGVGVDSGVITWVTTWVTTIVIGICRVTSMICGVGELQAVRANVIANPATQNGFIDRLFSIRTTPLDLAYFQPYFTF